MEPNGASERVDDHLRTSPQLLPELMAKLAASVLAFCRTGRRSRALYEKGLALAAREG